MRNSELIDGVMCSNEMASDQLLGIVTRVFWEESEVTKILNTDIKLLYRLGYDVDNLDIGKLSELISSVRVGSKVYIHDRADNIEGVIIEETRRTFIVKFDRHPKIHSEVIKL